MIEIIVPARMDSSRFPGKVLRTIEGKPILQLVWERIRHSAPETPAKILTDSAEVASQAEGWGADVVLDSSPASSGTERIANYCRGRSDADTIINIQGDDPFITPEVVQAVLREAISVGKNVLTPVFEIPHTSGRKYVHCVTDRFGRAIYFSRASVPFVRDREVFTFARLGHIGVYIYRAGTLAQYREFGRGDLEDLERLEQLRFLEMGVEVMTFRLDYVPSAIDSEEDYVAAKKIAKLKKCP